MRRPLIHAEREGTFAVMKHQRRNLNAPISLLNLNRSMDPRLLYESLFTGVHVHGLGGPFGHDPARVVEIVTRLSRVGT